MAQRRFSKLLVTGIVVGYTGFLLLVLSIVTESWFIVGRIIVNDTVLYGGRPEGLFDDHSGAAMTCQAFGSLSFVAAITACVLGILSSYAVTRPRIAGFAVKRLRIQPRRLVLGPKVSGAVYALSGIFTMTCASIATSNFLPGTSVRLAWASFAFFVFASGLLISAEPPVIPAVTAGVENTEKKPQHLSEHEELNKVSTDNDTLPREVANAATLPFNERRDVVEFSISEDPESVREQLE